MPWLGVVLYLAAFFLLLHLVDRLATRTPPSMDNAAEPDNGPDGAEQR